MNVTISPKAEKQLKKLNKIDQIAIIRKIQNLYQEQNIQKLQGHKDIYRVRVGDFRIVFKKSKKKIYI